MGYLGAFLIVLFGGTATYVLHRFLTERRVSLTIESNNYPKICPRCSSFASRKEHTHIYKVPPPFRVVLKTMDPRWLNESFKYEIPMCRNCSKIETIFTSLSFLFKLLFIMYLAATFYLLAGTLFTLSWYWLVAGLVLLNLWILFRNLAWIRILPGDLPTYSFRNKQYAYDFEKALGTTKKIGRKKLVI